VNVKDIFHLAADDCEKSIEHNNNNNNNKKKFTEIK
jgi:hypothetical protein